MAFVNAVATLFRGLPANGEIRIGDRALPISNGELRVTASDAIPLGRTTLQIETREGLRRQTVATVTSAGIQIDLGSERISGPNVIERNDLLSVPYERYLARGLNFAPSVVGFKSVSGRWLSPPEIWVFDRTRWHDPRTGFTSPDQRATPIGSLTQTEVSSIRQLPDVIRAELAAMSGGAFAAVRTRTESAGDAPAAPQFLGSGAILCYYVDNPTFLLTVSSSTDSSTLGINHASIAIRLGTVVDRQTLAIETFECFGFADQGFLCQQAGIVPSPTNLDHWCYNVAPSGKISPAAEAAARINYSRKVLHRAEPDIPDFEP